MKETHIKLIGELIKSQKKKESFLEKVKMIQEYIFGKIKSLKASALKEEDVTNLIKLLGILLKSMKNLKSLFPTT